MKCHACNSTSKRDTARLPRGWHRKGEQVYCTACWGRDYILRAVTMVVASPLDCTWEELYAELRKLWRSSTAMANWTMTRLRSADPAMPMPSENGRKLPPWKPPYLYPEARKLWPEHPSQSVISVLQSAQRKYNASRFDVVWRHAAALPTFRYPMPYPVHNQGWSASYDTFSGKNGEAKCPTVAFRIMEKRVRLRLRGGQEFGRQLGQFAAIASGEAVTGELSIYPMVRRGTANRGSGEQAARTRLMVKMVAWLPKPATTRERKGEAVLSTDETALLVLKTPDGEWTLHADLAARWQREHARNLQHFSDDTKYEQRRTRRRRRMMARGRDYLVQKHHRRIGTFLQQAAAWTAGKAARANVENVKMDLDPRGRFGSFPWHQLTTLIKQHLSEYGISYEVVQAGSDSGVSSGQE